MPPPVKALSASRVELHYEGLVLISRMGNRIALDPGQVIADKTACKLMTIKCFQCTAQVALFVFKALQVLVEHLPGALILILVRHGWGYCTA